VNTVKRVDSEVLVEAGLAAMARAGKALTRLPSKGRAMIYRMPDGQTVRVRTCNDHVLIVVGDTAAHNAKLNIEGIERTLGNVVSYLLPTKEVEAEARRTHEEWLASDPNTKGDNKTWNLWFKREAPTKANDYETKWAKYRLDDTTTAPKETVASNGSRRPNIKTEVEDARRRIAHVADVPIEAVKITINFEG
jgi:hypothetical protein